MPVQLTSDRGCELSSKPLLKRLSLSTAPMSHPAPCGRGTPRWSVATEQGPAPPASIAELPGRGIITSTSPPRSGAGKAASATLPICVVALGANTLGSLYEASETISVAVSVLFAPMEFEIVSVAVPPVAHRLPPALQLAGVSLKLKSAPPAALPP